MRIEVLLLLPFIRHPIVVRVRRWLATFDDRVAADLQGELVSRPTLLQTLSTTRWSTASRRGRDAPAPARMASNKRDSGSRLTAACASPRRGILCQRRSAGRRSI